jgi:hypothetical protein
VPRLEKLLATFGKDEWMTQDALQQLNHAIEHARKGCISDVEGVQYTFQCGGMYRTIRSTSQTESWHSYLHAVSAHKGCTIGDDRTQRRREVERKAVCRFGRPIAADV